MHPNIGGIEQVTRDIAKFLAPDESIQQKVICFNSDAEADGYVCRHNETVCHEVDGVEVIRCGYVAKLFSQQISFTFGRELRRVMDGFRPDIVIFHYPNPLEAFFFLRYRKRPFRLVVFWHLDITKQKLLGKLFHGQSLSLLKRADKVIPASPNYIGGSPYLSRFREKCTVIPDCIAEHKINISPEAEQYADRLREKYSGKTLCFAVRRHVPYKGFRYLVEAAKKLDDSYVVCIGGSGPLTEELKEQVEGCENIVFTGRLEDNELKGYYLACDIFCFSSITKNEAYGLALAEAMYYGNPAVTFTIDGSGVNFVSLDGVTGIECPNRDSEAYACAIKRLAEDDELRRRYGENAHRRAEENFMFSQFSRDVKSVIEEL